MGLKSFFGKPFAKAIHKQTVKWSSDPVGSQKQVFDQLIGKGRHTRFGEDHKLSLVTRHEEFKQAVPVQDYEGLKPYIQRIIKGEKDVLWEGLPIYFAKTSGTTSGAKYIPITKESSPNHINSARNSVLSYVHETKETRFLDHKMIFLSGSPILDMSGPVPTGRLSGIVNHHVPAYLRRNQLPSYETNCIEDWETKLDSIIDETLGKPMGMISGIPPWVQMYFDKIMEREGKSIGEVFPKFSLFVHGGVNFNPYRTKLFESIGRNVASIETYPASEGFIAYQDSQEAEGLLLLLKSGIFYEFIPTDTYFDENPVRLTIGEVELGVNYAVIINSNAGLWGYSIGDTVKFVSTEPYRLIVTGRIKHFISAFGEHVIGEEVEGAMKATMKQFPEADLIEFTVAPSINPEKGKSRHEWMVEFSSLPIDLERFSSQLDFELTKRNTYYDDLISGNILKCLKVHVMKKDAFRLYMKSQGKLGGQNKVPRLSNDRKIADELMKYAQ